MELVSSRRSALIAIALAALAGACVSQSKHDGVVAKLSECNKDRDAAIGKLADLEKSNARLLTKSEDLEAKLKTEREESRQLRADFETKLQTTKIELRELRKLRADAEKRAAQFRQLNAKFRQMISSGKIKVYWRHGRMIVGMPSHVLFPSGKAQLSRWGERTLAAVAHKLKDLTNRRFLVAGHTDNVPIGRALFADNWELSAMRALEVTRFLIKQGMSPRNLAIAGYGEYDPMRPNYSAWGRKLNRRIELILMPVIPNPK